MESLGGIRARHGSMGGESELVDMSDVASLDSSVGGDEEEEEQSSMHAATVQKKGDLIFSGDFEGGNISRAQRVNENEYEISLRGDTLSVRHRLWFHFTVRNCVAGQQSVFSIINFSKSKSLYRQGMTPVVRSTLRPSWHRLPSRHTFFYKLKIQGDKRYIMSFAFVFDEE